MICNSGSSVSQTDNGFFSGGGMTRPLNRPLTWKPWAPQPFSFLVRIHTADFEKVVNSFWLWESESVKFIGE